MSRPIGVGLDFGTTNSLVAVAFEDRAECVRVSSGGGELSHCMPSVVYFDHDGRQFAGAEAIRQYENTATLTIDCPDCQGSTRGSCKRYEEYRHQADRPRPRGQRLKAPGPCSWARTACRMKSWLAYENFPDSNSWGRRYELAELVSWVLEALLYSATDAFSGHALDTVSHAVIGVPIKFDRQDGNPEARNFAIQRLRVAAQKAGLQHVSFFEEPVAALKYEQWEMLSDEPEPAAVAVDFGGGTFDVAVSVAGTEPWAPAAREGVAVGGEMFDSYIFRERMLDSLGLEGADIRLLNSLSSMQKMTRSLADRTVFERLAEHEKRVGIGRSTVRAILESGFVYDLWRAISEAKAALSSSDEAYVDLHKAGIAIRERLTRQDFESLIEDDIEEVRRTILRAVDSAGISHYDVSLVIRTGGSSSIPLFVSMLEDLFPKAQITQRPAMTAIAVGLAHRAREMR